MKFPSDAVIYKFAFHNGSLVKWSVQLQFFPIIKLNIFAISLP